jgi:glycosyltransferase involved in cell wall biosynthesis
MVASPFTIILLTYNEAANLPACLASLAGIQAPIFVVDSYSTDGTLNILEAQKMRYVQHPFENYAKQRNWAQANNPYQTEWVFHLDAGERFTPELVNWLNHSFDINAKIDGYMFSRRILIFNKWVKYGGNYPNYHLRLYRQAKGNCEQKVYDQHFVVQGNTEVVKVGVDIIDTVMDSWQVFTAGHARWAVFEAIEVIANTGKKGEVKAKLFGTPRERRRWLKNNLFQKSPLFLRAFLYFFYRYVIRFGFLDGSIGLAFHLLQGFWFRFLIDAIVLELKTKMLASNKTLNEIVAEEYGEQYLKILE